MNIIIRLIFNTYKYIIEGICPKSITNTNKNTINIDNNDNKKYNNSNYKKIIISKKYKKKKYVTLSEKIIKFDICGWCNNYIDTSFETTYIYMDNIYCNLTCRNNQLNKDKILLLDLQKPTKIKNSFSI